VFKGDQDLANGRHHAETGRPHQLYLGFSRSRRLRPSGNFTFT
jgi:hypothetical protein